MAADLPSQGHRTLSKSPTTKKRGFVLLITITLLAFLVLLLVSLATLTRVETQVAANNQSLGQARQNALLALNIALGQLQKMVGPDQRVTATADLENGTAVANPRWVGVYGNSNVADYSQKPSQITAAKPVLLNWLISGNEAVAFTSSVTSTDFGRITSAPAATSIPFKPTDPVPANLSTAQASDEFLTINSKPVRLLIGPNTAGSDSAITDFVLAPTVDITTQAQSIPGLSGTSPVATGRYAYWVGDQGMKARVNLTDSYTAQSSPATQADYQINSFITSQRSALEMVNYDTSNLLSISYPIPQNAQNILKIQHLNQLPLVGNSASDTLHLQAAAKSRFHDLVSDSAGILADSYAGGLKKDLTADIADPTTTSQPTINRPSDSDSLFPRENPADHTPTWGHLRAFGRTIGDLTPSLPSPTSPGVYPVISAAALGFDYYIDSNHTIQVALFPTLVLWNPYSSTLKGASYEIGYRIGTGGQILIQVSGPTTKATLDLSRAQLSSTTPVGNPGFVRFQVNCLDIPPGESHIYRLSNPTDTYNQGNNILSRAPATGPTGITNYATWSTGVTLSDASIETDDFFVTTSTIGSGQSFDVVLGEVGGISDTTNTSRWYQAVLDAKTGRVAVTGTYTPLNAVKSSVKMSDPALGVSGALSTTSGPTSALRLQAIMEARSDNSMANYNGSMGSGRTRWLVISNLRAPLIRNTLGESASTRGNIAYGSTLDARAAISPTYDLNLYFTHNTGFLAGIGYSQGSNQTTPAILFDALTSPDRLLSLGQLQHAQLAPYGFYPTYPFGNSNADVHFSAPLSSRNQQFINSYVNHDSGTVYSETLYDISWHLNRNLWDKYFVSGIPASWTVSDINSQRTLPNSRLFYYEPNGSPPDLKNLQFSGGTNTAYARAAANLMVKGAFNINSTSEQAWRAILSGSNGLTANLNYADAGDNVGTLAPIPRFSKNLSQPKSSYNAAHLNTMGTPSANGQTYLGNRGLLLSGQTTASLSSIVSELARSIVSEIRNRGLNHGPFLSISDFVNRRLTSRTATDSAAGIKGAMQAAIDNMAGAQVNPMTWVTANGGILSATDNPISGWDTEHFLGGPSSLTSGPFLSRFANAPKYLTQADIFSFLGPLLAARSDTFLIRAYGEVVNPITQSIEGKAWCEATVQRTPDYINTAGDSSETAPQNLLNSDNKTFGRRLKILSFRWLSPSDI